MSIVPEQTSIPRYAPRTEPPERYCDLRLLAEYEKAKAENKQRPAVAATADVQEADGTFRIVNTVITTATGAVITGKTAVPVESEYIPPFKSLHDFINDLSS